MCTVTADSNASSDMKQNVLQTICWHRKNRGILICLLFKGSLRIWQFRHTPGVIQLFGATLARLRTPGSPSRPPSFRGCTITSQNNIQNVAFCGRFRQIYGQAAIRQTLLTGNGPIWCGHFFLGAHDGLLLGLVHQAIKFVVQSSSTVRVQLEGNGRLLRGGQLLQRHYKSFRLC